MCYEVEITFPLGNIDHLGYMEYSIWVTLGPLIQFLLNLFLVEIFLYSKNNDLFHQIEG